MGRDGRVDVAFDARWLNGSGVGTYVRTILPPLAADPRVNLTVIVNASTELSGLDAKLVAVGSRRYSVAEQLELPVVAASKRWEIFHSPFYVAPMALPCRLVVTIHDIELMTLPQAQKASALARLAIASAHHAAFVRSAAILADSESTAQEIRTVAPWAARKVSVVPLAPDPAYQVVPEDNSWWQVERISLGLANRYFLAMAGPQMAKKNLATTVAAFLRYRREGGRYDLVIAGQGPGLDELTKAHPGIRSVGYVPQPQLRRLYHNAEIFVFPSLHEGFGLPILEAMTAGAPVLTSNVSAMAEVAGHSALLVDPSDAASIAAHLHRIAVDGGLRREMVRKGYARARTYSVERTARDTVEVYLRAAGVGGGMRD